MQNGSGPSQRHQWATASAGPGGGVDPAAAAVPPPANRQPQPTAAQQPPRQQVGIDENDLLQADADDDDDYGDGDYGDDEFRSDEDDDDDYDEEADASHARLQSLLARTAESEPGGAVHTRWVADEHEATDEADS